MSYINVSAIIKAPRQKVFSVLSNPAHYPALMPSDLTLKLISPSIRLKKGAEYEFRVKRFGIEQIWSLRVEDAVENEQITFVQSIGFFDKWSHTIKFEDFKDGETILHHFIEYELHFGLFGKLYDDLHLRGYITKLLQSIDNKPILVRPPIKSES